MKMTVNKFDVSATCRDEKGEELVSTVNIGMFCLSQLLIILTKS